jgi:hypothetical protein
VGVAVCGWVGVGEGLAIVVGVSVLGARTATLVGEATVQALDALSAVRQSVRIIIAREEFILKFPRVAGILAHDRTRVNRREWRHVRMLPKCYRSVM